MEQYQYQRPWIIVRNDDGEWDVSHMFRRIEWSGDVDSVCRKLSLEMIVSATDPRLPYVYLPLAGGIRMGVGDKTLFYGQVVSKDKSTDSSTMSVTCYDRGFYLKNSQASRKYSGETPEAITRQLCSTYGVLVGSLAQTGVPIRRKFSAAAIYKIIDTAYTLASRKTGKKYLLRFDADKLDVVERTVTPQSVILSRGTNLQTATYGESIESMKNRVIIVDSEGNFVRSISDDAAVTRYGLLAEVLTQSDGEDAAAEAREILEDNGVERTVSVSCLGHLKLITGNTVWIHEPYTGLANTCWIDADKHVWQNGVYTCSLTLNFKNTMRESETGSEVEE